MAEAWYLALRVIARHKVPIYWRMTYGPGFWWSPGESELLPNGFATQPFGYSEVASVTVYREARAGQEMWCCDLVKLRAELVDARGIRIVAQVGVRPWPSCPPTEALELSVEREKGTS
jgi:hypothetical protein